MTVFWQNGNLKCQIQDVSLDFWVLKNTSLFLSEIILKIERAWGLKIDHLFYMALGVNGVYQKFFCSLLLRRNSPSILWNIRPRYLEQKQITQGRERGAIDPLQEYAVACQGSGVSSKPTYHRTDQTDQPYSPLR